MSPTAIGAVEHRLVVGRSLRSLRERAGCSLEAVASTVGVGKATWSRVENGSAPIASAVVQQVCEFLGVTDDKLIDRLRDLASQTKSRAGWLSSYDDVVSDNFRQFIGLEATSSAICSYEPEFIPGLLQTPGYMRGLMASDPRLDPETSTVTVAQRQEIRQFRQELVLDGPDAKQLSVVIGETAVRRPYGGPEAMVDQLDHLLAMSERANVEIRVVPADHVPLGVGIGQFILLDYPPVVVNQLTLPSTVYVDGYLGFFLYEKPYDVETYRLAWNSLLAGALDAGATRDFLVAQRAELAP
jgi:transcriptional regulator with XRE-family HTH domain